MRYARLATLSSSGLRACSVKGASCLRNARAFFLFRSISYSEPPSPNRTVSSAGPLKIVF